MQTELSLVRPQAIVPAQFRLHHFARVVFTRLLDLSKYSVRLFRYVYRRLFGNMCTSDEDLVAVPPIPAQGTVGVQSVPDDGAGDATLGTNNKAPSGRNGPPNRAYLDRNFLLFLKDLPYCHKFPQHLFVDADLPFIRRAMPGHGMSRAVSSIDYRCDDEKITLELGRHLGIIA